MSIKNEFFHTLLNADETLVEENLVQPHRIGKAFVVCGPTAVGKGTVLHEVFQKTDRLWYSVSATTRDPRPGEINGKHYYFLNDEEFTALVDAKQMLEWATVHKVNRYGTPAAPVKAALKSGKIVILEVDLDGARQIRETLPDAIQIFIAPPSWEDLSARLTQRGTEAPEEQKRRLETAKTELAAQNEFDYVVINDTVANATDKILQIISEQG